MRLIDADTLKAEFTGNFHEMWHYTGIRALIDVAPTVDAEPIKHGHWRLAWETNRVFCYVCSECGDDLISPDSVPPRAIKHCQNCGAKMDGEVSELWMLK